MARVRRMFPGGNTSEGFYSLHDNIIDKNRKMLYILKGMPGGGKSSMMKEIGERALNEGYTVEYHHCPSDPGSIDGVVINELKIAIVDGTLPHAIDPVYPGLIDKIIDLSRFIESDKLILYKDEIIKAKEKNKIAYRRAFNYFKSSKAIYDEIESNNKSNMDFEGINNLSLKMIERIFNNEVEKEEFDGFKIRHLFSEAYTPEGYVDYTPSILDGVKVRYHLSGNIGTGRTTFLKRIIDESQIRNYHVEVYHNPLIPSKIDSAYIKEINTVLSTSLETTKYLFTPINFDEYFNLDSINQEDQRLFRTLVDKGIESLSSAKNNHIALETIYKKCVNYKGINEIREALWPEIIE